MRKKSKKAGSRGPAAKPLTTAELKKLAAGFHEAYEYVQFLQKRSAFERNDLGGTPSQPA